jgi:hypothetical protein
LKRLGRILVASAAVTVVGVTGAVAAPTAVEAATKYFSSTKVVTGRGAVNCPAGFKVAGGGYSVPRDQSTDTAADLYVVNGSYPTARGWRVDAMHQHVEVSDTDLSSTNVPYSAQVYVICVG